MIYSVGYFSGYYIQICHNKIVENCKDGPAKSHHRDGFVKNIGYSHLLYNLASHAGYDAVLKR